MEAPPNFQLDGGQTLSRWVRLVTKHAWTLTIKQASYRSYKPEVRAGGWLVETTAVYFGTAAIKPPCLHRDSRHRMPKIPSIKVYPPSTQEHATQVIAGLDTLEAAGEIKLRFATVREPPALASHGLLLDASGGQRVVFDLIDSPRRFDEVALRQVDYYFKRMHVSEHLPRAATAKIIPYGPNYSVMSRSIAVSTIVRPLLWRSLPEAKRVVRALIGAPFRDHGAFRGIDTEISSGPIEPNGRVLFLARAWDPSASEVKSDPKAQEDRYAVNQERALLIRMLRERFGDRFTGGFSMDSFSMREYPDIVERNATLTSRPAFIESVKQHTVCIATRGLHDSVGWKFAEYLAMARAVITEKVVCEFPFPISKGTHFLEFEDALSCIEQVELLVHQCERAAAMMRENEALYHRYLRPECLVRHALVAAGILTREDIGWRYNQEVWK